MFPTNLLILLTYFTTKIIHYFRKSYFLNASVYKRCTNILHLILHHQLFNLATKMYDTLIYAFENPLLDERSGSRGTGFSATKFTYILIVIIFVIS